jgi:hypothetical protein
MALWWQSAVPPPPSLQFVAAVGATIFSTISYFMLLDRRHHV